MEDRALETSEGDLRLPPSTKEVCDSPGLRISNKCPGRVGRAEENGQSISLLGLLCLVSSGAQVSCELLWMVQRQPDMVPT